VKHPTSSRAHFQDYDDDTPRPVRKRLQPQEDCRDGRSGGQIESVDPESLAAHPLNQAIYGESDDDGLEDSIRAHGILSPIVATPDDVILSGHRRWQVALRLKLKAVPVERRKVESDTITIIEFNRYRKKTDVQLWKEGKALERVFGELARSRMMSGKSDDGDAGGRGRKKNPRVNGADGNVRPDDRRKTSMIARAIGTNRKRWEKLDLVLGSDDTPQEIKDGLTKREIPLSTAVKRVIKHRRLKEREAAAKGRPIPKDSYRPTVIKGSCIVELERLDDESVHLFVLDPPYGISGKGKLTMVGDEVQNADFGRWDRLEPLEHQKQMEETVRLVEKKLVKGGSFYCFADRLFIGQLWDLIEGWGLHAKNILTWIKPNPVPNRRLNYSSASEMFVYAVKPGAKFTWNVQDDAAEMMNVWQFAKSTGDDRVMFPHPCQKPVALVERIIRISSNAGDVVCDCYAGSGTTGEAAWKLKRKSVLIEADPGYVKTITERIALLGNKK
jgi:site-specific DNA-methyltransferase (adenine-specific)